MEIIKVSMTNETLQDIWRLKNGTKIRLKLINNLYFIYDLKF